MKKNLFKVFCFLLFGGVCVVLGAITFSDKAEEVKNETKTQNICLENIAELSTKEATVTEIDSITKPELEFFNICIPFTESNRVYSYDFSIKAGFIVDDIYPEIDMENKKIYVTLPEPKILSNEMILESELVYHEGEKMVNPITLSDMNDSFIDMKKSAQNSAIENGLFKETKDNAKTVIKSLLIKQFPEPEYKYNIEFKDK